MLDPVSLSNLSQIRYQEMLQNAAAGRGYRPLKGSRSSWLHNVGHVLIAAGQKLKAQAQANAATPALNAK